MRSKVKECLVLAYYGAPEEDSREALARLKGSKQTQVHLISHPVNGSESSVAPEFRVFLRTILPGEDLVIAATRWGRVTGIVNQLRSVGAPAVFVADVAPEYPVPLPSARTEAAQQDTVQPVTIGDLEHGIQTLAISHSDFVLPAVQTNLTKELDTAETILNRVVDQLRDALHLGHTLNAASEWLVDNTYLLRRHIADVRTNVPRDYRRILPGWSKVHGGLRIQDLSKDLIRLTNSLLSANAIVSALNTYQTVRPLNIAELWSFPLMLRLTLISDLAALGQDAASFQQLRERAYFWANRLTAASRAEGAFLDSMLAEMGSDPMALQPYFLACLSEQLQGEDAVFAATRQWVEGRIAEPLADVVRQEHQREAAGRVGIANSITSLRQLSQIDFKAIFEETSLVDHILRGEPSGLYAEQDFATRDRCRHHVEHIARYGNMGELEVAQRAVERAKQGTAPIERHAEYYLLAEGRHELERWADYKPPLRVRFSRGLRRHPTPVYLSAIAATAGFMAAMAVATAWKSTGASPGLWELALILLSLFPLSDLAIQIVNAMVVAFLQPAELPSMSFEEGIPPEHATLVVVPMMLSSADVLRRELEKLEVRFLANPDKNLCFALFSDFLDADTPTRPGDAELLAAAIAGIEELNQRHQGERFLLFHRERVWSQSEQRWIGRERKRGKIEDLNAFLCGENVPILQAGALRREIAFVITLDADTLLPSGTARRLVETIAHPLNRVELTPDGRNRRRGFTIVQPRVSVSLPGATLSRFTRLFSDARGTDQYSRAVSDVYQDLFSEGIFHGKAIYDVWAFHAILGGRFPAETLLSHDLLEGAHVGVALSTPIELFEDLPSDYPSYSRREHRWIRGDWQIASWIFSRVPTAAGPPAPNSLSIVNRWKLADNLRRSLTPIASVALLLGAWLWSPTPEIWTWVVILSAFIPALAPFADQVERRLRGKTYGWQRVPEEVLRTIVSVSLLPHRAWISLDAISRSIYRRFVTGRLLLEWQTAETADRSGERHLRQTLRQTSIVALASAGLLAILFERHPLWITVPFLALWIVSPLTILWLGKGAPQTSRKTIDRKDRAFLRLMARLTWRYFDDLVGPHSNWLPPDNSQTALRVEIAPRTSPTNIGLWLTSSLAAVDFGYLTPDDFLRRCTGTIETVSRMERYEGHWLNWYDLRTLAPLTPRYVSTVDSGNLVACLSVLEHGLRGMATAPLLSPVCVRGLKDTVDALAQSRERDPLVTSLTDAMKRIFHGGAMHRDVVSRLRLAQQPVRQLMKSLRWQTSPQDDRSYWVSRLDRQVNDWLQYVDRYLLWMETLAAPPSEFLSALDVTAPGLRERALKISPSLEALSKGEHDLLDQLLELGRKATHPDHVAWIAQIRAEFDAARQAATETVRQFESLADTVHNLAAGVKMQFLYDSEHRLFGIGYPLDTAVEFNSHYDLLASECRLASLAAIAKGDVPVEHWLALGRPYITAPEGQLLLSWSGTMFEYLMPLLFTRSFENSLLDAACRIAVDRQIEFGREKGRPWGVSESAYRALDANHIYQYRAFGIPDLALRPILDEELVVSPYSSFLALPIAPGAAIENLERLRELGLIGPMGFYEAIDFTNSDNEKSGSGTIIYCYMAHHQAMSLLSLDNLLNKDVMQRRFHADLRVRAVESLLFERIPPTPSLLRESDRSVTDLHSPADSQPQDQTWQEDSAVPHVHLLGNGRYAVTLTNAGSGYSRWNDFDLNRWRPDTTLDCWGSYFYLRDMRSGVVWSATHQPAGGSAGSFTARFSVDRAEFVRKAYGIETVTGVWVAPEDDVEIRRIRFHNQTARVRELEVTSYMELALAAHAADVSHPAFSKLFVETEYSPNLQALLARRRPRSPEDPNIWVGHTLLTPASSSGVQYESNRTVFLGRGRGVEAPQAMSGDLTGSTGTVLDPIFSLRCRFPIAPRESADAFYITVAGSSREQVESLLEKYRRIEGITRTLELCWTHAQLELRYLGLGPASIHQYQELASHLIYPNPRMRPPQARLTQNTLGQPALWAHGISGDLPILTVAIANAQGLPLVREALLAHTYWRLQGFRADVVILNQEQPSYDQPLRNQLLQLIQAHSLHTGVDQPGGVFLRDWNLLAPNEQTLLLSAAHATLSGSRGTLAQQLARFAESGPPQPRFVPSGNSPEQPSSPLPFLELSYFNGLGGFSPDGAEYAIYLKPGDCTPAPWANVIANPRFGTVVSESGLGFSWHGNSQSNRLTPWHNDPSTDPQSEIIYIRDDDSGAIWTPTPLPIRENDAYRARHGQGYTVYEHNSHAICQQLTVFVPVDDAGGEPLKIAWLRLRNESSRRRKLTVTFYAEWVLGTTRDDNQRHIRTSFDASSKAIFAVNPWRPTYSTEIAFAAIRPDPLSWSADRTPFLGRNGSYRKPGGLGRSRLNGRAGAGLDPAAILQTTVSLQPQQETDVICLLGEETSADAIRELVDRYGRIEQVQDALTATKRWWDTKLGAVQVQTPIESVNFLMNRWLLYQSLSCRFWARSAVYQSGGAFGFRDQLQDSLAFLYFAPELTRRHLIESASRQFTQGDVQHWWHPETGLGVRTRCSDDLLWLPFTVAQYIGVTGDSSVLAEDVPFLTGPELDAHEHERLFVPSVEGSGSILEHCLLAIKRSISTVGPHGLPLMGSGDWNDGMNRVGIEGRGESVWLAWFLISVVDAFSPILEGVQGPAAAREFDAARKVVALAVEESAWDGEWYARGFFDDGTPIGTRERPEAKIDSLPQSWAVIGGASDPARAATAMASVEKLLVNDAERLILIFTPPFDNSQPHPGYIMGYPPGIRENGGQYTHAAVWTAAAMSRLGRADRAAGLLQLINPVERCRNPESVAKYAGEPYIIPADVYSAPDHLGRAGWTWYTGSSSWFYRTWLEEILGLKLRGSSLSVEPKIPSTWPGFSVRLSYRTATYQITVERQPSRQGETLVDGKPIQGAAISLQDDGQTHQVLVEM